MTIEFRTKLFVLAVILIHADSQTSLLFVKAGQAYFISDGAPINTYEFFRPLVSKYFHIHTGIISVINFSNF